MNIFKTSYSIEDINPDEIDMDSFRESLLGSMHKVQNECYHIDKKVRRISRIMFIPTMSTLDHYDAIMDLMSIKAKLISLRRAFRMWFNDLNEQWQALYKNYFIEHDYITSRQKLSNNKQYMKKYINTMSKDFTAYARTAVNFDVIELIHCPFIYSAYVTTYNKKLREKQKKEKEANASMERN